MASVYSMLVKGMTFIKAALSHLLYWSQRLLTAMVRLLSQCQVRLIKNGLIHGFVSCFDVHMTEAENTNPFGYPSFDAFFTRALHPGARPIASCPKTVVCPSDGKLVDHGICQRDTLMVAKYHHYDLASLLADNTTLLARYAEACYATFYLAPHNYHRVHMPFDGQLKQTLYVPGWLFSVHPKTIAKRPSIYAKNERLICDFDTEFGPMLVIMIGACLVGSMSTSWGRRYQPMGRQKPEQEHFDQNPVHLAKGQELGRFHYGSSVMVLWPKGLQSHFDTHTTLQPCKMGQAFGVFTEENPS